MGRKENKRVFDLKTIFLIFLLLAILLITVLGTMTSWRLTVREMEQAQVEEVQHRTASLFNEIQRQIAILDGYSASFTWENIQDLSSLLKKLDRFVQNTEFSLVCFAYPNGTLYRHDGAEVDVSHRYYFQQGMQGTRVVEFLENNNIDTTRRVGMAVPVILDDDVEGVLLGLYGIADFRTFFERNFSGFDSLTYICDSTGKLILGTEDAEAFLQENGLSGVDEDGSLMDILAEAKFSTGSKDEVEQNMLSGRSGQVEYKFGGTKRYTTYAPLGVNDWYIVSVLHETHVLKEAISIVGIFYAMVFISMLAVLAVIIYLFNREAKKAREIQYLLEHDTLTGILSERAFLERVNARRQELRPREYCVVFLDIYKFKLINQMFEYHKGDELLRTLAEELDKFMRQAGGLCARISGDSFVLFMPHKTEYIREFNTKKYKENRIVPLDLYLHYGIYVIDDNTIPANQMVDAARLAQKVVKGNYDNCVSYYNDQIKDKLLQEQEIISTMGKALRDEEFVVYLQPQYNYRTGAICGAEALVRWLSPEKGLIPPGEFIPIFETNGFILRLDEYVWEQVCRLQRKWIDEGRTILPVSVNVSRSDLLKGSIAQKLTSLIEKYSLTPDLLRVEITESAYMDIPQQLISEIQQMEDSGFTVEMDDFGSGYSSLNMLKDVPFHVLKTDLKFLSASGDEDRKNRILDNVIRMAHEMGMSVIAEGVETKEQADYLLALDCEQMQGYYFSRPIPWQEYEKQLSGEAQ